MSISIRHVILVTQDEEIPPIKLKDRWSNGHMMSCDKKEAFYLLFHKTFMHQKW